MQLRPDILAAINLKAESHLIPAALIAAFVAEESGGNPWRTRYEPAWSYYVDIPKWAGRIGTTQITERVGQSTSWGLMQVMGGRARELGFQGLLPELCQPEVGLELGCCDLRDLATRFGTRTDATPLVFSEALAASYNAGSARKNPGGTWVNQAYVDAVKAHYADFVAQGL